TTDATSSPSATSSTARSTLEYGNPQPAPNSPATTTNTTSSASATSSQTQVPDSWKTYENEEWGFKISAPVRFEIKFDINTKSARSNGEMAPIRPEPVLSINNTDHKAHTVSAPGDIHVDIKPAGEVGYQLPNGVSAACEERGLLRVAGREVPKCFMKGNDNVPFKYYVEVPTETRVFLMRCDTGGGGYGGSGPALNKNESRSVMELCDRILSTLEIFSPSEEGIWKADKEQVPDSWGAYKNDKWGFALQYPQDVYGNFQVESQYSYGSPWSARVTAEKHPVIEVSAHRLDEYEFAEPNGQIYGYQLDNKNSWITEIGSEEAYEPPTVSTRSGSAYKFERGVIGETADVYAIPDETRNVMFTIKFIYNTIQDSDDYTTQTVDQKAIVSSFISRANGKVIEDTLSTKGIKDQYEDGLAEKIAKERNKPFIEVSEAKPMDFVRWDYNNDGEKSIAVVNIKSSTDPEKDLVQEVVIFDIGNQDQLSNPQVVWEQSYSAGNGVFWDKVRLSTTTHNGRAVLKNTKQFSNETAKENHFVHYRNGSFYDAYSLAKVDKQAFLSDINKQYTEELLSDPAFVKEGSSVKGGQTYEITAKNREPVDFVRWDHDDDGEKSLAVLNRAGNVFELILFGINKDKEISNPRRIDERGSATWVWRSADLEVVGTYQGKFVRSKIWIGNSAPHVYYYSFQDGSFENRGRKTAEVGSECEVGFVYPKGDTVLNQGKIYEVRWKDLFNDVSRTRINPVVSRRDIKIINENEEVIGKLKTGHGLGQAAEWQSLRVLNLDGDSLTDEGRLVEPGKYKLRADYYTGYKIMDVIFPTKRRMTRTMKTYLKVNGLLSLSNYSCVC
ncbi:MAG: hypothetical protein BRC25_01430, partial [Parcubacteria group bacterium SW_6_46_9]